MGNFDEMYRRIGEKMQQGFRCIKLKIGAIDFEKELELLAHIRRHFTPAQIELRVDANGAFSPVDAMEKLKRLSELDLHSIEQPIRAGQWEEMARLTSESPLPIALDEELIGCNTLEGKQNCFQQFVRNTLSSNLPFMEEYAEETNGYPRRRNGRLAGGLLPLWRVEYRAERYRPVVCYV